MKHSAELSRARRIMYWAATAFIPLVFFALLEGGLRLGGYGTSLPLFMPVPGAPEYLTQNRDVARRYFSRQARVPTSIGDAFPARKAPETFRIVVQGGSSAAGYPYYYGGSFSRMLQQRMQQTFPSRRIEVINTAMAAVNSYTLLDLAHEILAIEPDAVLIYAGHNEFYGALGVGSAESLGRSRTVVLAYLALQEWRTVQLLRGGLAWLAGTLSSRPQGAAPGATLMERMVGEQEIPLGSPVYRAGMTQWRLNLRRLLAIYRDAGVAVYVGTIASNERDHPPFLSAPATRTDTWDREIAALEQAVQSDPSVALDELDALAARDTLDADVEFLRGRALDALTRYGEARRAYVLAKDRDRLRFRATEEVNTVIREEAALAGARVAEVRARLSEEAPGGIIDGSLMLEHLHPNAAGYFFIADAFYDDILNSGVLPGGTPIRDEDARREILLTPVDSLFGHYRVLQLKGSWPFEAPGVTWTDTLQARSALEEITLRLFRDELSWFEATSAWLDRAIERGDHRGALLTALAQIQQYPFLPGPYAEAGQAMIRLGRAQEALPYFQAALEQEESAAVREVIGDIHAAFGRHDQARDAYLSALAIDGSRTEYALKLGRSHALLGDTLAARDALRSFLARNPQDSRVAAVLGALEAAIQ